MDDFIVSDSDSDDDASFSDDDSINTSGCDSSSDTSDTESNTDSSLEEERDDMLTDEHIEMTSTRLRSRVVKPPSRLLDEYKGYVAQIGNQGSHIVPLIAELRNYEELNEWTITYAPKQIQTCAACGIKRLCSMQLTLHSRNGTSVHMLGRECTIVTHLLEMAKILNGNNFSDRKIEEFDESVLALGLARENIQRRYAREEKIIKKKRVVFKVQ